jgi:hypothetical protein
MDDVVAVGEAGDGFTFLLWDYFLKNDEAVPLELLRVANFFQLQTR